MVWQLSRLSAAVCCLLAPLAAVAAPESSAKFTRPGLPITVEMGGRPFTFEQKEPGVLENVTGDLVTRTIPRVRYLTGSQHFDATYPSRAFELVDRAIMRPDHAKPIHIGGAVSAEYVPIMQFALQRGEEMAGFWVAFEWGSAWSQPCNTNQDMR